MAGAGTNSMISFDSHVESIAKDAATINEKFQFSESPNFESLRTELELFASERDWDKFHTPRNLILAMVGEVGELSELFQWRGEVRDGLPDWSEEDRRRVGEEMSDVLLYLLRLADKCKIDLPQAAVLKIQKNAQQYPAQKVYGSSKKYTQYS